jgi:ATP-dependent helicase/nuclease subunit B
MHDSILAQFSENSLILTANRRLSRHLIAKHDRSHRASGVWQTLNCLPLQSWLTDSYLQALAAGDTPALTLLSAEQEQYIWELIVQQTDQPLLNRRATANQIRKAWQLIKSYDISPKDPSFRYTQASQYLQKCIDAFSRHCQTNHLLDQTSLMRTIIELINHKNLKLPNTIVLMGFLEQTPLFEKFIRALKACVNVEFIHPIQSSSNCQISKAAALDTQHEMAAMAAWVKDMLSNKPNAKIACIVPELTTLRRSIDRIFATQLENHQYNISGGNSLFDEPIIATALQLLRLAKKPDITAISHLLRSPFLGGHAEESQKRALLDAKLREGNYLSLNLKQFIGISRNCPSLKKYLLAYAELVTHQAQSPRAWAASFSQQLAALAWPADRALTSREHQAIQQWQQCLDKLASLELIAPTLSFTAALRLLTQFCKQQLFQIQTNDDAPIQVLGLLEAVGLPFEHVWVMGLDNRSWPANANPHPFLPQQLQREHKMPHANAERELQFAMDMQAMLAGQTDQLVLSYPEQEGDQARLPSRLLYEISKNTLPLTRGVEAAVIPAKAGIQLNKLEILNNDPAPPTSHEEKIKGGSAIFKQQAACPFRAFAQFRLQAEGIAQPTLGLTAAERGILVHQVLEMFWQQVRSQQQLCALSDSVLQSTLRNLIKQAIDDQIAALELPKRLLLTEEQRLMELLNEWLAIEKAREPFTVIAEERWQSITVGGIPLRLQIDRIDQLEDGSCIIIDYKTGMTSLMNWFGDRPNDLQLPLYATNNRSKLSGLYFAQIRAGEMCFKGLSQVKDQLPGTKTLDDLDKETAVASWEGQLDEWQAVLEQLADDFHAGIADVDPKYGAQTCQYCEFRSLCRVHEQ